MALGVFDDTKDRYRPQGVKVVDTEPESVGPSLGEIWEAYTEAKRPQLRASTIEIDYRQVRARLAALPTDSINDVALIRNHLLKHHPVRAAKKTLMMLNAALRWAVDEGLIVGNPLEGAAKSIRVPKAQGDSHQPDPFTKQEWDAILAGFQSKPHSARYVPLLIFLNITGCRPSEAIAVRWGDVRQSKLRFQRDAVSTPRGIAPQDGLKTQSSRDFPINRQLEALLQSIKPESPSPSSLIFPAPRTGGYISWGNFTTRHWRPILTAVGIRYREPYCIRDTFITNCLEAEISPVQIARWVGNSAEIIWRRYAGVIEKKSVPES
jgi:integrase